MDINKKPEDDSTELSKLIDEVVLLCSEEELILRFNYSRKYLNEQKSKAKKAKKEGKPEDLESTIFRNLTWIRNDKKLQKENDEERFGKFLVSKVKETELANSANPTNETKDPGAEYKPNSHLHGMGTVFDYYERGESGESDTRKLFTEELFKDSKRVIDIVDAAMLPGYPPGSIIGIQEVTDTIIIPGNVYVVERGNDLLVRRLYYKENNQETNILKLVADNNEKEEAGSLEGNWVYPPFYIDIAAVKKLFKVTWVLSRMS